MTEALSSDFLALKARYFDPLSLEFDLLERPLRAGDGFAIASAERGPLRLFLDYERGLGYLAIGPATDEEALCSISAIASRLPSSRTLTGGSLRLSFEEQCVFIRREWSQLSAMFSEAGLSETKAWNADRIAADLRWRTGAAN